MLLVGAVEVLFDRGRGGGRCSSRARWRPVLLPGAVAVLLMGAVEVLLVGTMEVLLVGWGGWRR